MAENPLLEGVQQSEISCSIASPNILVGKKLTSECTIFLDTSSTTPIAPEAVAAMLAYMGVEGCYYNPSSTKYLLGQSAESAVSTYRLAIANQFGCDPDEVIFTSGATESNNLALRGIALAHSNQGRHLVTSMIEHKSVLETARSLEKDGFEVTYIKPDHSGLITPDAVKQSLRPDTLLVSIHHVNNETGVIQPIDDIANMLSDAGVLLHVDAAQSAGKLSIDLGKTAIDMLSFSGHKFYGPKGIGCLIVRDRRHLKLSALMTGGGQEFGVRSGTLPTHQIAGMSTALDLVSKNRTQDLTSITELKREFIKQLRDQLELVISGEFVASSPYIINFSIPGITSDALINQLSSEVALSSGSACSSGAVEASYVLRAMGIEGDQLYGAVRASFSRYHSVADITLAVERIIAAVRRMQELN